jgi:hypothetical protein
MFCRIQEVFCVFLIAFCLHFCVLPASVELVDVSDRVPGLLFEKGVSSWKIMSRDGEWFEKYEEVPEKLQMQFRPQHFPPANAASLHLERWCDQF